LVKPEAEPLRRFLLDRKRLLADANNDFSRGSKDFSAPAELM
jgi:hypothetical protein